jgi:DNA-binding transcriptional MerR regulator
VAKVVANSPKLYSISQVHALTGVPKPTLRFWEKEFKEFLDPLRTAGNQRRYDTNSIENVKRINHLLKVEGYTLEGARKKLEAMERAE